MDDPTLRGRKVNLQNRRLQTNTVAAGSTEAARASTVVQGRIRGGSCQLLEASTRAHVGLLELRQDAVNTRSERWGVHQGTAYHGLGDVHGLEYWHG